MGLAIAHLREQRELERDELAATIEEEPDVLAKIECGEVNADWATLRAIAQALDLPLGVLMELAEEQAPGDGGDEWRQRTRASELERERKLRGGDEE